MQRPCGPERQCCCSARLCCFQPRGPHLILGTEESDRGMERGSVDPVRWKIVVIWTPVVTGGGSVNPSYPVPHLLSPSCSILGDSGGNLLPHNSEASPQPCMFLFSSSSRPQRPACGSAVGYPNISCTSWPCRCGGAALQDWGRVCWGHPVSTKAPDSEHLPLPVAPGAAAPAQLCASCSGPCMYAWELKFLPRSCHSPLYQHGETEAWPLV